MEEVTKEKERGDKVEIENLPALKYKTKQNQTQTKNIDSAGG